MVVISMLGWLAVWFAYQMSVTRGKHRGRAWGFMNTDVKHRAEGKAVMLRRMKRVQGDGIFGWGRMEVA